MTSDAVPNGRRLERRPWLGVLAIVGLLAGMALIGAIGIAINRGITNQADEALAYDTELEDSADEFRVSVLNVRQYHRDLLFNDPTAARVREWETHYSEMVGEINELAELGVRNPGAPQPEEMQRLAEAYYLDFRPAIDLFETQPREYEAANLEGLERIEELSEAATQLDLLGERLAAEALSDIARASENASLVLLTVLAGIVALGAVLGLAVLNLVESSRRLADRERAAARALSEASQAKSDFMADISHQLRTPLTVVRGNAEVGLAEAHEEEQGELLREIAEEAGRMTKMVDDLLFLARSDSAGAPLHMVEIDAAKWLQDLEARASALARGEGAEILVELGSVKRARIDPDRLSQAVLILVDNAAKYAGGSPIRLSASVQGEVLEIRVTDEGPGIPEPELPRIFDRYHRVPGAGPRSGTGLGLAIARAIVEGHGGRISARSTPGAGTTMTIEVPLPGHA